MRKLNLITKKSLERKASWRPNCLSRGDGQEKDKEEDSRGVEELGNEVLHKLDAVSGRVIELR